MREPPAPKEPGKAVGKTARADRLAQALRANLGRRKAQRRARTSSDAGGATSGQNDKNEG